MREHMGLYRGKELRGGKWVFGNLLTFLDGRVVVHYYVEGCRVSMEVDPETVGECTGLRDKNGKLIFEGDVFDWGYAGVKEFRYVVAYDAELASFAGNRGGGFVTLGGIDVEIIGNIHDTPELLKGERND